MVLFPATQEVQSVEGGNVGNWGSHSRDAALAGAVEGSIDKSLTSAIWHMRYIFWISISKIALFRVTQHAVL